MKICWDNLEKLEYRYDRNAWQDKKWKHVFYIYKDSCKNCGEPFLAQEGRKRRFCDHSCATSGEYHPFYGKYGKNAPFYGKKHSKKTIRKMRVAKIGENHPFYDKKLSKEHREKLSETKIGENNPNWKGGISCEPYCDVWLDKHFKESIKERDGYKCLNPCCSKNSERLCIHHINYIKKDCSPFNLITLCISCNTKANSDREWHKAWYKIIIQKRYK